MNIALVVAMAKNRVIGYGQRMPWHLPADLKHFRRITLHKPIIMGRKTYESIGCVLPERRNMVITRQNLSLAGVETFHSVEAAFAAAGAGSQIMVIGGQAIFEQTLNLASTLYITKIDLDVQGDTFFPAWDASEWLLVDQSDYLPDSQNCCAYQFLEYRRIRKF